MTQIELFLELAKPDENGVSKKIYATEFVGKYSKLRSGNGYKWPERIPFLFERGGRGDNWFIKLVGNKKKEFNNRPIRENIRKNILTQKCVHTGFSNNSSNPIIVDHKNGRYDDDSVLNIETQNENDFQPLVNQANLQKRTYCNNVCIKTNLRFDAKKLGYKKSVYKGSLKWEGSCVGCYWYSPIDFKKSL